MKKITILFACILCVSLMSSCKKTSATKNINKANLESAKSRDMEIKNATTSMSVDLKSFDFGTVNEGDIVERTFKITNTGNTDLVITKAVGSCGCTVPEWPKEAILPGVSSEVRVKFNTSGKPNKQQKSITLYTNTATGTEFLTLVGNVIPKQTVKTN